MATEKEILTRFFKGDSQRTISAALRVSRNTVAKVVKACHEQQLEAAAVDCLDSETLHRHLFPEDVSLPVQVQPDYECIHKELLKSGVTLKLLWDEYAADCQQAKKLYFMYSQFCKRYRDYVDLHRLTMHIHHKPGERLMVDWAGTTLPLYNPETGSVSKVYLFVATLPFSMYCYAEACRDMKEASWIQAHIHLADFLGGTPRLLVSDNLKTGILQNRKHEDPIANRSYQELANHYNMVLLPARVLAPKDKAAVEGSVGQATTHIIAKLRNRKFFDLYEMNMSIHKELDRFNEAPFQKKDGSRKSVFYTEELPFLQPLPKFPYEYAEWRKATVQLNYHITLDYQNYSVPFEFVRKQVDVRFNNKLLEIYYEGRRIASHKRILGHRGQYSTITEHMPMNHQLYSQWDGNRFRRWAKKCGIAALAVVEKQLASYRVEEQAYKGCLLLLKLADTYGADRLEAACTIALQQVPVPRYKLIHTILATKQDQKIKKETPSPSNTNAFVRGAAYYGGGHHDK